MVDYDYRIDDVDLELMHTEAVRVANEWYAHMELQTMTDYEWNEDDAHYS